MHNPQVYPKHIYEPIREEIAISYIQHEFRKLLWRVPEKHWGAINKNIADWMNSPNLAAPRDFWNGFHGISMGFKLIIGFVYLLTAENIIWKKKQFPLLKLHFGVEQEETKIIRAGKLPTTEVATYFSKEENHALKENYLGRIRKHFKGHKLEKMFPIIVIQKGSGNNLKHYVHDGNRRLTWAVLEGADKISAYVGKYTTERKFPKNYWIPTSILMDNLFFAKIAYDKKDKRLFGYYMKILKDMLNKSESAIYEMKERALITSQQPFKNDVLKALGLFN